MIRKIFTLLLFVFITSVSFAQQLVNHKGQDVFFSGINLAWMSFGRDLDLFDEAQFSRALDDVSKNGGNSIRWWLHVNGGFSPAYKNDSVSGIDAKELNNLKKALDIAAEKGIVISLCLWSFDMLKADLGTISTNRNKLLLTDSTYMMAYINNALIPMVNHLKGHTAIMCWEIFNEAEGMTTIANWDGVNKVDISAIQTVVNRCAGAIHRTDPSAKVSTGVWNARAMSDVAGQNYYSNKKLIEKGGDADGYLDFYMMHYYPAYEDERFSPFHHPASYWGLDKPIVIAEFPAKGIVPIKDDKGNINFKPKTQLTSEEAYNWAYENGYAGAMSWTWTNHDGFGGIPDIKDALADLKTNHPDSIIIQRDKNHNYKPEIIGTIPNVEVFVNADTIHEFFNLKEVFKDDHELTFTIKNNGATNAFITKDSLLSIAFLKDSASNSIIEISADDQANAPISTYFAVNVIDLNTINHCLTRPAYASSTEKTEHLPLLATDGYDTTRWSSEYLDNQWYMVDLKETEEISRINLSWENAYPVSYNILVSTDSIVWDTVFAEKAGNGGIDNIVFNEINARFIKIDNLIRATQWGNSLWEIKAFTDNGESTNSSPTAATKPLTKKFYADSEVSFVIPKNLITDKDGDKLSYTLEMADGSSLPNWLTFNANELKITGTPTLEDLDTFAVVLTATDWFNNYAEYTITISIIKNTTSIDNNKLENIIYNTIVTNGLLKIYGLNNYPNNLVVISDVNGRIVFKQNDSQLNTTEINTNNLKSGIYNLKIQAENTIKSSMIIIY